MDGESRSIEELRQRVAELEAELAARERAVAELRRVGEGWRRVFDAATDGFWSGNADGVTVFASRVLAGMLGRSVEEMEGKPLLPLLRGGWREVVEAGLKDARRGRKSRREFQFRGADGGGSVAVLSMSPDFDEAGRYAGALFAVTDVTQRKQTEQALRESEARFRRLVENERTAVYRYDLRPSRGFSYVSPTMEQILGYSPEEFYADPDLPWRVAHPADLPRLTAQAAVPVPEMTVSFRAVRRDGHTVWLEQHTQAVYDESGSIVAFEGITRDVTRRKEAEEAVLESEARFRAIFDRAATGIAIVNTDRAIVNSNQAFQRMLGYSSEEVRRLATSQVTYWEDAGKDEGLFRELVEGKREHYQIEKRLLHKDRRVVWALMTFSLVRNRDGTPRFVIGMTEDVTERKLLEEQLLRSQRLEVAGRIAAQVAHDFNNLLSPLVAYPDLIQRQLLEGHPALAYCKDMQDAALQIAHINEDMLALGRRGRVDPQPVDLNRLVRQVLGQMSFPPGTLRVEMDLGSDLLRVAGAQAQLVRVIANLVANAREAMSDRGTLSIKTENVYVDEPTVPSEPARVGEYVKLTVGDTGRGIPEGIRDRVFDAFFSTKPTGERHGSGLGLSVVQTIVEDHGGFVGLESEVGQGTTFRVYIPASRAVPEERLLEGEVPRGTETILAVDDDRVQREMVRALLEPLGYRVETAAGGEAAVAHLRRRGVGLLILDMVMPQGMDGVETYRQALRLRPGQRAILLSGYAEAGRVREAQALGAGALLRKPVTLAELAQAVRRELDL